MSISLWDYHKLPFLSIVCMGWLKHFQEGELSIKINSSLHFQGTFPIPVWILGRISNLWRSDDSPRISAWASTQSSVILHCHKDGGSTCCACIATGIVIWASKITSRARISKISIFRPLVHIHVVTTFRFVTGRTCLGIIAIDVLLFPGCNFVRECRVWWVELLPMWVLGIDDLDLVPDSSLSITCSKGYMMTGCWV